MEKKILLIAGESSGDIHGAALSRSLAAFKPNLQIFGVGGTEMRKSGVHILHDNKEMAVVGVLEIFGKIRLLYKIFKKIEYEIVSGKYSALVLIDYPTFNMMLAWIASKHGLPVYYFIAPQVWAWGKIRLKLLARIVNKMFVILPFEKEIYEKAGMDVEFVGHPFIGEIKTALEREKAYKIFGLNKNKKIIGILPGSRNQEIKTLLPVMLESARIIKKEIPTAQFALPLANTIEEDEVATLIKQSGLKVTVIRDFTYDVMSLADFLIVASGSVTLEAGILKKPMVIIYKVNFITSFIARILALISHVGLVNIIAGKEIVPELLQENMTPENIASCSIKALTDEKYYKQVKQELAKIEQLLGKKKRLKLQRRALLIAFMKKNLFKYILPYVLFVILYLIGKTLRVQIINRDVEYKMKKQGQAAIGTFWHGRMLYFPYLYRFTKKFTILISPSEDGEIVASTLKFFGFSIIRGSSYENGENAMLKLISVIRKGKSVILVGDGSRGPCYEFQKGIIKLAHFTGAPIVPVTYGAKNKIQLNSWDRFIIPLPFSKIKVMYGDPVYVVKNKKERNLQSKLEELQKKLKQMTQAVDSWD